MFYFKTSKHTLSLTLVWSLSSVFSHSHTHTHTHTLSLSLSLLSHISKQSRWWSEIVAGGGLVVVAWFGILVVVAPVTRTSPCKSSGFWVTQIKPWICWLGMKSVNIRCWIWLGWYGFDFRWISWVDMVC